MEEEGNEKVLISEIQLLLAEKRTSLAAMRTGIAVFALPLSVLSVLVATSEYYDFTKVAYLLIPLLVISLGLVVLGVYLTHRSIRKVRHFDDHILELKRQHPRIAELID
jgi:hypothetical protein